MIPVKVEEKLFQNRYRVDAGRPHISIINSTTCQVECKTQECTVCCPAGCLECGTCRIICSDFRNVAWEYPRGGYGILFKFG
jgi:ferredoxin like protein